MYGGYCRPMTDVTPFQIDVADAVLDDLQHRLANTRWPEAELVDDWSQGIPLSYVQELTDYWANSYDWRVREALLNRFDQVMVNVQGVDIHAIHVRSKHEDAMPLVLTHGWPGSIVEFHKVIEPLTDPTAHGGNAADAFHVVAPALPGYGFSGKPTETGWGVGKIAEVWDELMGILGYDSYVAQGGDWGAMVTTMIGANHDDNCRGIHINMVVARPDPDTMDSLTEVEQDAIAGMTHYNDWDSGYSKQQSTRPQTLGYGLADSPVGQMAWIVEKFWAWTDCDGHPENALTKDEILDNVMLYWATNSAASSARLYWESFSGTRPGYVKCPTGAARFPKEIFRPSRRWAEKNYNITYWREFDKGGHFAAFEQPEVMVGEIREFFRTLR